MKSSRMTKATLMLALATLLRADGAGWTGFRAEAGDAVELREGFLWLEAEAFADYGGWVIDTQFVGQMGSAYIMAAGTGCACANASTEVKIPRDGTWRVWARTRDWIPEYHPGRFAIEIAGRRSSDLGTSGKTGWCWQSAGDFALAAGRTTLRLVDLTGWFARCDAIILTTDLEFVPANDAAQCEAMRSELAGIAAERDGGSFDVIVVGAGPGGTAAAVQAARRGAKTLLVHDRPIPGGNGSTEIHVPFTGIRKDHPGENEIGISAEMRELVDSGMDGTDAAQTLIGRESMLTQVANTRIVGVTKGADGRVCAVRGVNTLTGAKVSFAGKVFVDATGDGWVGYFAGAKFRQGSEGRDEFGEQYAPNAANGEAMSGSLWSGVGQPAGSQIRAFSSRSRPGETVAFVAPDWANLELPAEWSNRSCPSFNGEMLEHPHAIDEIADLEYARDYLIRMSVTYWDWCKNKCANRSSASSLELVSIPYTFGRREGRRLVGDYILTEVDELAGRRFEDEIGYGGYPVTTHNPAGSFTVDVTYPRPIPPLYGIPFRCLYSVNIPNLLMCGRCCSMTHRALGSMRVQATCAVTGQAAGLGAALCVENGVSVRDCAQLCLPEIRRVMLAPESHMTQEGGVKTVCGDQIKLEVLDLRSCWDVVSPDDLSFAYSAVGWDASGETDGATVTLRFDSDRTGASLVAGEGLAGRGFLAWTPVISNGTWTLRHIVSKGGQDMETLKGNFTFGPAEISAFKRDVKVDLREGVRVIADSRELLPFTYSKTNFTGCAGTGANSIAKVRVVKLAGVGESVSLWTTEVVGTEKIIRQSSDEGGVRWTGVTPGVWKADFSIETNGTSVFSETAILDLRNYKGTGLMLIFR